MALSVKKVVQSRSAAGRNDHPVVFQIGVKLSGVPKGANVTHEFLTEVIERWAQGEDLPKGISVISISWARNFDTLGKPITRRDQIEEIRANLIGRLLYYVQLRFVRRYVRAS